MSTLFHTSLWQVENEFVPQLNRVLTNVRSVNKTDVVTLLDVFGNLSGIVSASCEALRILFTESEILLDILTSLFWRRETAFYLFSLSSIESVLLSDFIAGCCFIVFKLTVSNSQILKCTNLLLSCILNASLIVRLMKIYQWSLLFASQAYALRGNKSLYSCLAWATRKWNGYIKRCTSLSELWNRRQQEAAVAVRLIAAAVVTTTAAVVVAAIAVTYTAIVITVAPLSAA
jgi:hypothetical protein